MDKAMNSQRADMGIGIHRIPRVTVVTDHAIAYESPDHVNPWGTSRDNSRNPRFNAKLYGLFSTLERPLRILDLGCSGGGFVRDCLNDGCFAVGIEGSDYSARMSRAEWPDIGGKFLFTADITKPFSVCSADDLNQKITFDVITSWDVLEHIAEIDIHNVCDNIHNNLEHNGICIFSISFSSDVIRGIELHQTIKPRDWWMKTFQENGFRINEDIVEYFNGQYIRGPKQNAPHSFHLVLTKHSSKAMVPMKLSFCHKLADAWYFSKPHLLLRRLIAGP